MSTEEKRRISVIIPALNAEKYIKTLLDALFEQTIKPDEIVVVDSESEDNTTAVCKQYSNVRIIPILRKDFDHGKTRDMALRTCDSDYVLFITQDAYPKDKYYIENLLKPFQYDEKIAISSGRQIARKDATPMEKCIRNFNYPEKSSVRSKDDLEQLGIKTFFFSDVCSAYRKDIYEKVGGFEYPIKTNEDMFFAAKIIQSGYKIAYAAEAVVVHSHNLTLKEQYQRNYIQGYEIERHKNILGNVSQNSEGVKLVKKVSAELIRNGHIISFVHFGFDCCARVLGSKMGSKKARVRNL